VANEIKFTLDFDQDPAIFLRASVAKLKDFRIISKSLDARGAPKGKKPKYHYIAHYILEGEEFSSPQREFPFIATSAKPIIIGMGPAGLFAALRLLEYGIKSILFERGESTDNRMVKIAKYWRYGEFDEDTNVCYGEGGAGLYSDGKLVTRVKSDHISYIMARLVDFGAPKEVAYEANPHLGSNKMRGIIKNLTEFLEQKGCEIHYNSKVDKLLFEGNKVIGVESKEQKYFSSQIILAPGHSPKELFEHLLENNVQLKEKNFAIGVRIEHPRFAIDQMQYGPYQGDLIGAARYRLSYHDPSLNVGTYSFCMCPGGHVLSSTSSKESLVTNGMSNFGRNAPWSNSALIVSVDASKVIAGDHVLRGFDFQHKIENDAYQLSLRDASGKELPAQRVKSFLAGKKDETLPHSSCPSKIFAADLNELLPKFICDQLKEGIKYFDKNIQGFICDDAILIAPETRTSCPVTIEREKETLESLSHQNLYPCGEGAGYAGGITSAAVDGVRVADSIFRAFSKNQ
jgi:uncharacterized FAD-dependent dehydrogenase